MAALNLAADLVILWLDPAVPASHYQSPYKLTDALAMGPAIIASPVGGLAELCGNLLWPVPFGDFDRLVATIGKIFADDAERARRRERARKLFLREFSYNSVPAAIADCRREAGGADRHLSGRNALRRGDGGVRGAAQNAALEAGLPGRGPAPFPMRAKALSITPRPSGFCRTGTCAKRGCTPSAP